MKKNLSVFLTALCMLLAAACPAEEGVQADAAFDEFGFGENEYSLIAEAPEPDRIASMSAEGRMFVGWRVYEYDAETMEVSEAPASEEGVLCFELSEDSYMILREYTVCAGLLSDGELAEYACEGADHVAAALWMTGEEYLEFVKEQADAINDSLENDPLTQADMNLKSAELLDLWSDALNVMLDEAARILPEDEMRALTAEQSAWQEAADQAAEAAGREYEGGSMYALIVNGEAAALAEARVYEICELLK